MSGFDRLQRRGPRLGTVWRDRVRADSAVDEPLGLPWHAVTLTVWVGPARGTWARVAWRPGRVETWRPASYRWSAADAAPAGSAERLARWLLEGMMEARERCLDGWDREQAALEAQLADNPPLEVRSGALTLRRELLTARQWLEADRRAARHHRSGLVEDNCQDRLAAQQLRVDSLRELTAGVLNAYFSGASARLNEIVKTLTVVTTVMLPASLVAALYGMNFRDLPGAASPQGFWIVVGGVGALAMTLLALFRRRHWI